MIYSRYVKRAVDVAAASILLVVLLPLFLATGLVVLFSMGRPVIFRQVRIGYREKPFALFKFRTMRGLESSPPSPVEDRERLTPVGDWMRRTSLDELPQLINVLLGQMSFIGPRPLLPEYLPLYQPHERRRHDARPGISGWAQVNGRTSVTWGERFELDLWYVSHQNAKVDAVILYQTLKHLLAQASGRKEIQINEPFKGE